MDHSFECIILTETHKITNLGLHQINGYKILYNNGSLNINDGMVVYIKEHLEYNFDIIMFHAISVIELQLSFNNKKIYILAIYRSPSLDPTQFNIDLYNHLQQHSKNFDYGLIIGDINIDIMKNTEHASQYLDILSEFGYSSTINEYTRVQQNSKSCIDHIFLKTNHDTELVLPLVIQTDITDHYITALQIIIENKQTSKNKPNIKFQKFINYKKLNDQLITQNWNEVYACNCPEMALNTFLKIITDHINSCTNFKKIKHNLIRRKEWINDSLVRSVNKKQEMYLKMKNNTLNNELKVQYNNYKKYLDKLITKTKKDYYRQKIENNKHNKMYLWKTVNSIKNYNNTNKIYSIKNSENQNQILTSKLDIANEFNNTFINTGRQLANNIVPDVEYKPKKKCLLNSFYLLHTDTTEVNNTIKSLKNKKSTGIDNISVKTIKEIANHILEPLTYIINLILSTSHIPTSFKTSVIKPIYKKGDRQLSQNYRPISIITNFAKVFEKILKIRLDSYIKKYQIIATNQYGFQKNVSTQDAISHLTNKVYTTIDKSLPSLAIFLDLAKAFDTVNFTLLMEALQGVGIRGRELKLLNSYVFDRRQCVEIEGIRSQFKVPGYGVPQGTVLGPLLFIIYINDLFLQSTSGEIITFADDTVVYYEDKSWKELKDKTESDFTKLKKWFNSKILTLNIQKTFFLPFASYKSGLPNYNSLLISDINTTTEIIRTNKIKYLGIYIDQHLKWDAHIEYIVKKLRCIIPCMKYLHDFVPLTSLVTIYHAIVQSHLNYGILGWGGVNKTILNNLEVLQKRILKIMFNKDMNYPTNDLFTESHLFDTRQLFYYAICIYQYKNKNTLSLIPHKYSTRKNREQFTVQFMKKSLGQRNYAYLAPKIYSILPENLRNAKSLPLFKKQCKKHILELTRLEIHKQIDLKNN